jgi:SpoIID/LytB domain protein
MENMTNTQNEILFEPRDSTSRRRNTKRIILIFFVFLTSTLLLLYSSTLTSANPDCSNPTYGDFDYCIKKIQNEIDALKPAQEYNKKELADLKVQLDSLEKRIAVIAAQLDKVEKDILEREEDVAYTTSIFNEKTNNHYKFLRLYDPILPFLSSNDASEAFREINFRQIAADEDRKTMEELAQELIDLKNDKDELERSQGGLASLRNQVRSRAVFLEGEVEKTESYLAELSAKQEELLAAKFASAPVPLLAYTSLGGCSSDIGKDPGFSPRYGFFSYGVPNKTGLNQYGAKGRAEAGQSYEQILNAYYADVQIVDYGTGFNITVNGTNEYGQTFVNETMNIEEYLKHLYEMPSSWDSKALQAQAIAARSYALARTNNGQNSIPPNQTGQVVKKELNAGPWINAVTSTNGKVMVQGGNPISAWYSSTHGGVVLKSGQIGWSDTSWTKQFIDTPSGSAGNFSELLANAYDKQSPWFYCDWGYRSEYNKTAWLKEEEVVDIVNAYVLWSLDSSTITHLSQADKPTSDTWTADKVRQEIQNKGGSPISSISSIGVAWDNSGISRTISVNGRSFDAQKFKNLFNLRAPANIQIKPTCHPDSGLNCNKMYALFDVIRE